MESTVQPEESVYFNCVDTHIYLFQYFCCFSICFIRKWSEV